MRNEGLLLTFVCGLVATGASALLGQTASDGAARFTENAMKLRESILFKSEPSNLQKDPLAQPGEKYPWHVQIVTTVFWIGETSTANNPVPNRSSAGIPTGQETLADPTILSQLIVRGSSRRNSCPAKIRSTWLYRTMM